MQRKTYEDILNEAEKIEAERIEFYMDFRLGEASSEKQAEVDKVNVDKNHFVFGGRGLL